MAQSIMATVGPNSANRRNDVLTVQALLNAIPSGAGGPAPALKEDGLFGGKTAQAISKFQTRQFGWQDGMVTPEQQTLKRLNDLSVRHNDLSARTNPEVVHAVRQAIAWGRLYLTYPSDSRYFSRQFDEGLKSLDNALADCLGGVRGAMPAPINPTLLAAPGRIPLQLQPVGPAAGGGVLVAEGAAFVALTTALAVGIFVAIAIAGSQAQHEAIERWQEKVLREELEKMALQAGMVTQASATKDYLAVVAVDGEMENCKKTSAQVLKCLLTDTAIYEALRGKLKALLNKAKTSPNQCTTTEFETNLKAVQKSWRAAVEAAKTCLKCTGGF